MWSWLSVFFFYNFEVSLWSWSQNDWSQCDIGDQPVTDKALYVLPPCIQPWRCNGFIFILISSIFHIHFHHLLNLGGVLSLSSFQWLHLLSGSDIKVRSQTHHAFASIKLEEILEKVCLFLFVKVKATKIQQDHTRFSFWNITFHAIIGFSSDAPFRNMLFISSARSL